MRTVPRLVLPFAAALALAGCGASAEKHYARAQAHFAAEDYRGARAELVQALRKAKSGSAASRQMLLMLAAADLRMGDGDAAQSDAARLRAAGLDAGRLALIEGEAALLRGQGDAALAKIGDIDSPDAWRIRAAALGDKGDGAGAQAAFQQGLARSDDPHLRSDYVRFLLAANDYGAAAAQLDLLRRARPQGFNTLMLEGALAEKQGGQAAAIAAYARAAKLYPARAEPLLAHAGVLDLEGKVDAAIVLAQAAAKLAPEDNAARELRLSLYSEKGDWEKVRGLLQHQEGQLDPNSADGMTYAEALLRLGHAEQARALYAQALLTDPGNRYARMMLGEAQLATKDPEAAYATLRPLVLSVFVNARELELTANAATAAHSADADALRARLGSAAFKTQVALVGAGQAAAARGDYAAALGAYQQIAGYGSDPELLKRMAFAASNLGRHAEAIGWADQAMATNSADSDSVHLAGLVRLNARSDLGTAQRLLQAAVDARPDYAPYKADLARAKGASG